MEGYEALKEDLKQDEGYKLVTYYDTEGILSGGIGRNLEDEPHPPYVRPHMKIPPEIVDQWFEKDLQDALHDAEKYLPWYQDHGVVRRDALLNLLFNMGWGRLSGFVNTLNYWKRGDFEAAARGLTNSLWARQVQASRSSRIIKMVREGTR